MRLTTALAIAAGIPATAVAVASSAQNLLVNGDFDTDLVGWYESASWVEESWSPLDANGSPTSGSVRQENVNTDGVKASGIGQCVPLVAGVDLLPIFGPFAVSLPPGLVSSSS